MQSVRPHTVGQQHREAEAEKNKQAINVLRKHWILANIETQVLFRNTLWRNIAVEVHWRQLFPYPPPPPLHTLRGIPGVNSSSRPGINVRTRSPSTTLHKYHRLVNLRRKRRRRHGVRKVRKAVCTSAHCRTATQSSRGTKNKQAISRVFSARTT